MKVLLKKLNQFLIDAPPFLKNKYILSLLIFGIWMVFFDGNNLIRQVQMQQAVKAEERKKTQFEKDIAELKSQHEELETNKSTLEKFAREKYLMKRDNEEIILFVPRKEEPES